MNQACGWPADSQCCSSRCVCHFPLFVDVHEGRLGVSGLIIVFVNLLRETPMLRATFVSDYMLKNLARIEITG